MRRWLLVLVLAAACSAIFQAKRPKPPDTWSLEAAVLHSMMTAPDAFVAAKPDCTAASMPDLQFFCEKKCDQIGELSLKAYCSWECDDIKNPDLAVICRLEVKRTKGDVRADECNPIYAGPMREHCKRWVASQAKPKQNKK